MKKKRKMRLYYSGSTSGKSLPEQALRDKHKGKGPDIMLTFFEIITMRGDTKTRIFRHIRKRAEERGIVLPEPAKTNKKRKKPE